MMAHISQELFTTTVFAFFEETFNQVQGIYLDRGTSLFETLAGVTAVQASQPVSATCASLAAQVAHVTFYLDIMERYTLKAELAPIDWGEIWRTVHEVTPEEWQELQTQLRQSYERVLGTFHAFDSWDDEDIIGGALAMVVHTAYHLGEIRQALCVLR